MLSVQLKSFPPISCKIRRNDAGGEKHSFCEQLTPTNNKETPKNIRQKSANGFVDNGFGIFMVKF